MNDDDLEILLKEILASAYPEQLTFPQIKKSLKHASTCPKSAVNRVLYHRLLAKGLAIKKTKENTFTPLWEATSTLMEIQGKGAALAQGNMQTSQAAWTQPSTAGIQPSSSNSQSTIKTALPETQHGNNQTVLQEAGPANPTGYIPTAVMQYPGGVPLVPQLMQQGANIPMVQQCPHLQLVSGMMPYAAGTWCAACGAGQVPVAAYPVSGSPGVVYDPSAYTHWVAIDPSSVPEAANQVTEVCQAPPQQALYQTVPGCGQNVTNEQHLLSVEEINPNLENSKLTNSPVKKNPNSLNQLASSITHLNVEETAPIVDNPGTMPDAKKKTSLTHGGNIAENPVNHAQDAPAAVSNGRENSAANPDRSQQNVNLKLGNSKINDPILISWLGRTGRTDFTK